jgi:hypothetical protein
VQSAVHALPSHDHVSSSSAAFWPPPKRRVVARTESKAIAASGRAEGELPAVLQGAAAHCGVQVVPSHSQVSPRRVLAVVSPPKSTATPRALSNVIDACMRAGGAVTGWSSSQNADSTAGSSSAGNVRRDAS